MIRYEKSGKTMDEKGWCGDEFSDAGVPEKLFINFFRPYTIYVDEKLIRNKFSK